VGFKRRFTQTLLGYVVLKEIKPLLLMQCCTFVDIYAVPTQPLACLSGSRLLEPGQPWLAGQADREYTKRLASTKTKLLLLKASGKLPFS
jgi:hypothetical protein